MTKQVILSLLLTTVVGLTMGIGSLLSFFKKGSNQKFFSLSLSFAAGIMIYVSFMGILPQGIHILEEALGNKGKFIAIIGFFASMVAIALIEKWVHKYHVHGHGHEDGHIHYNEGKEESHLSKLGLVSALAIALHNLPEGLAIFTAGVNDMSLAIPIALAIILHNIPLGIAISVPILHATGSKKKAFLYTTLVGLCQPLGGLIGYLLFSNLPSELFFGVLSTIIAGIMIFVALDELLPTAQKDQDHHISVYGAMAGMFLMAISLSLFSHGH